MAFGKNSPETRSSSSSTTKTEQQGGSTSAGANSTVESGPNFSDVSGVGRDFNVVTTDQGAVAAGLQVALKALDANATNTSAAIVGEQHTAEQATSQAVGVASTVAQGQQNVTFKYVTIIIVGVASVAGVVYYASKR